MRPGVGGLLTGALLFVASPGVDLWPLAFVALVPLMLALQGASFRRTVLEGFLAGALLYGPGLNWLPESLAHASFAGGKVTAWLGYVALVAVSSARVCLACVLAWVLVRGRVNPPLAFSGAFAASELVLPGFVPYTLAASLHSVTPLLQIAEWGGSTWIVLLLAAVNAYAAALLGSRSKRERGRSLFALTGLLISWLGLGLWLEKRARATFGTAHAASRVLIVQPKISEDLKRTRPSEVAALYRDVTRQALRERSVDWVIWGETALVSPVEESRLEAILGLRTQGGFGVPLLAGIAVQGRELYNSAVSVDAAGRVCPGCRYDKRRLVPFVEAWPFSPSQGGTPKRFASGSGPSAMHVGKHPVAMAICYEALYAEHFRDQVAETRPELLVSLASDLWLQSERAKALHLALIQLRAIEHRRFLIHATAGAPSASIDPMGGIQSLTGDAPLDAMVAKIRWLNAGTLWARLGNWPFWGLLSVIVVCGRFRETSNTRRSRAPSLRCRSVNGSRGRRRGSA